MRQDWCAGGLSDSLCRVLGALLAGLLLLDSSCATARDFSFKDMQGKEQRLSAHRGKWVLVNFWATWCPPCLAEMPDLLGLYNAHRDKDLVVIGVSLDSTRESVVEFVTKMGITYPIVVGDYKMAAQIGNIDALPTTYLFDPTGKPVGIQQGVITRNSVEEFMRTNRKK
jgi:thiol-disulfide isomerase/thioredoxin